MHKKFNLTFFLILAVTAAVAQIGYKEKPTLHWITGQDAGFIAPGKSVKIQLVLDSLTIEGKDDEVYQQEMAAKHEANVPGEGKLHMDKWHKAKRELFPRICWRQNVPKYKRLGLIADTLMAAPSLIMQIIPLNTTTGTPGLENVTKSEAAFCDIRVRWIETAGNTVVGEVLMKDCAGKSNDFDFSFIGRFKNCFLVCSYYLMEDLYIKKGLKK
jgi:hypothetical protein